MEGVNEISISRVSTNNQLQLNNPNIDAKFIINGQKVKVVINCKIESPSNFIVDSAVLGSNVIIDAHFGIVRIMPYSIICDQVIM